MNDRTLGTTGLRVSTLGLGAAGIGDLYETLTDEQGAAVVRRALDLGITYIDTAPLYGYGASEHRIGLALRGHPRARDCIVATKIGYHPETFDFSFRATMQSVEHSLARLGLSVLPIVQIHEIRPDIWDPIFAPDGALAALRALQAQHVVGHIGITGSHLPTVARAIATGEFETLLLWRHYHLLDASGAQVVQQANALDMGVIIGTPFAGGILASGDGPTARYMYEPAEPAERARTRALEAACASHGVSLPAAAMHFCLRPPGVASVIAGADAPAHVERNVRTLETTVPEELLNELA